MEYVYLCNTSEYDAGAIYHTKQRVNLECIQPLDWDNLPPHTDTLDIFLGAKLYDMVKQVIRLCNLPYYITRMYMEDNIEIYASESHMPSKQYQFRIVTVTKLCTHPYIRSYNYRAMMYYNFNAIKCNCIRFNIRFNGVMCNELDYLPMLDEISMQSHSSSDYSSYTDYMPRQLLHYIDVPITGCTVCISDNMPPNCSIAAHSWQYINTRNCNCTCNSIEEEDDVSLVTTVVKTEQ
jgi:hypothetical protein